MFISVLQIFYTSLDYSSIFFKVILKQTFLILMKCNLSVFHLSLFRAKSKKHLEKGCRVRDSVVLEEEKTAGTLRPYWISIFSYLHY